MQLDLHWVNILILFGAIQGLVFIGILLLHKKHPGRIFLALVMTALVYNALETFNWSTGLNKYAMFFDFFPFVTIFLIGPGFYFYFKSLLVHRYVPSRKEIFLFFSPFLFQLTYAGINVLGYFAYFKWEWKEIEIPLTWMFRIYDFYSEIWSLLVFLFFTVITVVMVRKNINNLKSGPAQKEIFIWVKSMLVIQVFFAIGWALTLLVPIWYTGIYGSHYYPIELFLVLFLYWSAMAGYWKVKSIQKVDLPKPTNPEAFDNLDLLRSAMENEKLFLNPHLNLQMVAEHLGIPTKEISYALNQAGNTNFNDFVNNYRVETFCEKLESESKPNLTIFGIAQECGFNSPATFQRAFKKAKNMSPKVYLVKKMEYKATV
ncbi:helix-turn-helix domain-containing protein [Pararhodonellum marinum]|uniref:helix-turn-helix domain-containing protein n=1 Tax=Pararhodonellum marinum TaxID=2755358 RepID=UPI00188E6398|nr:helix-turn-helix domain-containing protein [Pararhodonellum marinum]